MVMVMVMVRVRVHLVLFFIRTLLLAHLLQNLNLLLHLFYFDRQHRLLRDGLVARVRVRLRVRVKG